MPSGSSRHAAEHDLRIVALEAGDLTEQELARAEELGLTSIAFPALGTGVGGFPLRECAAIMLEAVAAASLRTLTCVEFVLFDQVAYDAFAAALQELR